MIELSDLVVDWFKEKEFPVKIYRAGGNYNVWWIDLDIKNADQRALFAIANDGNPPYVMSLSENMRTLAFFNPGDPEFFNKIEAHTKEIIDLWTKESQPSATQ